MSSEVVRFRTQDEVEIVGDIYGKKARQGILLLHMMPSDRKSWSRFAQGLVESGFIVLAIDLRGHGDSTRQGSTLLDYKSFSDDEHQASIYDVQSSVQFLRARGAEAVYLCGASIGANLALWHASEDDDIKKVILLSPGLSYRGIEAEPLIGGISRETALYLESGGEQDEYSRNTVKTLFNARSVNTTVRVFDDTGHGMSVFEKHPEFIRELVIWIS